MRHYIARITRGRGTIRERHVITTNSNHNAPTMAARRMMWLHQPGRQSATKVGVHNTQCNSGTDFGNGTSIEINGTRREVYTY